MSGATVAGLIEQAIASGKPWAMSASKQGVWARIGDEPWQKIVSTTGDSAEVRDD
jgi:hypothetical protein